MACEKKGRSLCARKVCSVGEAVRGWFGRCWSFREIPKLLDCGSPIWEGSASSWECWASKAQGRGASKARARGFGFTIWQRGGGCGRQGLGDTNTCQLQQSAHRPNPFHLATQSPSRRNACLSSPLLTPLEELHTSSCPAQCRLGNDTPPVRRMPPRHAFRSRARPHLGAQVTFARLPSSAHPAASPSPLAHPRSS